jgi:glycerol transport system permease protein
VLIVGNQQNSLVAYIFLTPALVLMLLCAVVPLGFVIFYSMHDTFGGNDFIWVGLDWYTDVLFSRDFHLALARTLGFSLIVLAVEIPLGLYIARRLPAKGIVSTIYVTLMAIPLLAPTIAVGHLWKALTLPNAGLIYELITLLGFEFNMNNVVVSWCTLVFMDVWHWTGLVVLLCFAGLRAIPVDHYNAARVDGAGEWAIFRYVELPKLKPVLLIAVLLRFMDSFMIYADAYIINRGGPGVATTFLSQKLVQTATVEFNLGEAGAMSIMYFAIILCVSWALFRLIEPRRLARTSDS